MKKTLALALAMLLALTACAPAEPGSSEPTAPETSTSAPSEPETEVPGSSQAQQPSDPSSTPEQGAVSQAVQPTPVQPEEPYAVPLAAPDVGGDPSAPAKQSWPAAYDSFYDDAVLEGRRVVLPEYVERRGDFVYPVYSIVCEAERADFLTLAENINRSANVDVSGLIRTLEQAMTPYHQAGMLVNHVSTDDFYGEARIDLGHEVLPYSHVRPFKVGNYEARTSLTMTESIENQLLHLGFNPETTTAHAVIMEGYADGIAFIDTDNTCFYVANAFVTAQTLQPGMVYNWVDIADDIASRIDKISPEVPRDEDGNPIRANPDTGKPVIYLYPERELTATVKLDYAEDFTYTYPAYNGGWRVKAQPDGTLTNLADGSEHYYLFWEGDAQVDWDFSEGFVVKGSEVEAFLRESLATLGLTQREYNDFITYWAPEMSRNEYNLVTFATTQYEELAPLTVTPAPDTVLRVHMVYRPCTADTVIAPQTLAPTARKGFTVVEWGGTRAY